VSARQLELFAPLTRSAPRRAGLTFTSLQSGSEGNATLVQAGGTTLLIDCGLSPSRVERRLAAIGRAGARIDAVFVTHEHSDHAGGCGVLARHLGVPIHVTHGTAIKMAARILRRVEEREHVRLLPPSRVLAFKDGALVDPGLAHDVKVEWFPVPHDGAQPVNFVVERAGVRAAVLTDLGHASKEVRAVFETLDVALLEANHDRERLRDGPYPRSLKQRIASSQGHLSNGEAARLVRDHASPRLRLLVLGHLSQVNNDPVLAEQTVRAMLERRRDLDVALHVAPRDRPSVVLEV